MMFSVLSVHSKWKGRWSVLSLGYFCRSKSPVSQQLQLHIVVRSREKRSMSATCQNLNITSSCCTFMHILLRILFMLLVSWPSDPDGSIQVAGENNKYGSSGYSQSSCWFMNANVARGLVLGHNELQCVYLQRMNDWYGYFRLHISFLHDVYLWWQRGKGWGNDARHYATIVTDRVFFQLPYLLVPPPHQRNGYLPV